MKWTSSLSVLLVWPWKLYYTYLAYQILKLINKCALHINNAGTFTYLSLFQAYMLLSAGTLIHALPLFNISQYIFNFLFKKLSMFIHIYPYICCFLCFLSLFHLTFHILLLTEVPPLEQKSPIPSDTCLWPVSNKATQQDVSSGQGGSSLWFPAHRSVGV